MSETVIVVTETDGQERRYTADNIVLGLLGMSVTRDTGSTIVEEVVARYQVGSYRAVRKESAILPDEPSLRRLQARSYDTSADLGTALRALREIRDSTVMIGTARSIAHAALNKIGFDSEDEADDSTADALDAQSLHDSPGSDL